MVGEWDDRGPWTPGNVAASEDVVSLGVSQRKTGYTRV